jgi:ferredoxin-nitrite reductase
VLNDRSLTGLPRKFNVAFDGGGCIATLEETNDIGFQAVRIVEGFGVEPGVWFRVLIGGVTGHGDLARDVGVICRPDDCTGLADAILRVFIESGDRTDRTKARLKYVLDAWGFDKFLAAVEAKLGRPLTRVPAAAIAARPPVDRSAHIGVHPQAQRGLNWMGVSLTVGRLSVEEMRGVAGIAGEFGDGDIRLTVWQNLIVSGVADDKIEAAKAAIEAIGLDWRANALRAGLVACTGSTGCKFAAAHTKEHAVEIAAALETRLSLDAPINIHLTGCHHSCAQHYIGDIGLLAAKVSRGEDEEPLEGYSIVVGGGFAERAGIGRELWRDVPFAECTGKIEGLLRAYIAHRAMPDESFHTFANRQTPSALKQLAEAL